MDLQRFLELVMPLPQDLEEEYRQAMKEYERRKNVPVLTQWEKIAMNEGRQEGRQEIALDVLDARFPEAPTSLRERLAAISNPAIIRELVRAIARAGSLTEVEQALDARKA